MGSDVGDGGDAAEEAANFWELVVSAIAIERRDEDAIFELPCERRHLVIDDDYFFQPSIAQHPQVLDRKACLSDTFVSGEDSFEQAALRIQEVDDLARVLFQT